MDIRRQLILLVTLAILAFPSTVYAQSEAGQLLLSASDATPVVGGEFTVAVRVEGAPTIYGADVLLTFDPALLEVVDADGKAAGIQLKPGDFIDANKSFYLQHGADNQKGTVDYALALLNPAPPAAGDGLLVEITFRVKAAGPTQIALTEGEFGTQTGETLRPTLASLNLNLLTEPDIDLPPAVSAPLRNVFGENQASVSATSIWIVVGIGSVLVLAVLGGLGLWLKRKRK